MKAFLPDFGCCKNHLLISLKLARNPPIDVQCFCTVSCSLVCFICSEGQKSLFSKWAPMVVCTRLLVFLLQTLASCPPMMNGQWVFESVLLYEMKAFSPDLDVARITCWDHWNLSGVLQLMFNLSPKSPHRRAQKSLYQVGDFTCCFRANGFTHIPHEIKNGKCLAWS